MMHIARRMSSVARRPETFLSESMLSLGTRSIYTDEHDLFRRSVRKFWTDQVQPQHKQWEADGQVSREIWREAGKQSLLGLTVPAAYGGPELDVLFASITWQEQHYSGCTGPGFALHSEIVAPYLMHYGSEEQKKAFLPRMVSGELITAIAMTEPAAGSDLQGMKTTARESSGGDLVLNGSKTFITNGAMCDLVIVCARTDPAAKAAKGISLLLVETGMAGFKKGRRLDKIGLKAQDTSELYFTDVRVPKTHVLGRLNDGFPMLMKELPQERLMIADMAVAAAEALFEATRTWCKTRVAFGQPLISKQVVAHKLANMKMATAQTRLFVDKCIELHAQRALDAPTACMAKIMATELQNRIADDAVQLHGGTGFMADTDVGRGFVDARVQRIYGGSNEVLTDVVARTL